MQKHCSRCTTIWGKWGDIMCWEMKVKKLTFKFMFKCQQCRWWWHFWRKTVPGFAAATQNARSPTVWRRVCGTATSTDDAKHKRCRPGRSATCCRLSVRYVGARPADTEMRVLPAWTIFALVHKANADGEVEAWSGHTNSQWTLVVLLHSSSTITVVAGTTGDQPMLHSRSPASIIPEQPQLTGRRSESVNDGYFSVVSAWKKFDTMILVHANGNTCSHQSLSKFPGHAWLRWHYEVIAYTNLQTGSLNVGRWIWWRTDKHHMILVLKAFNWSLVDAIQQATSSM